MSNLFSRKHNKNIINFWSAELAQRVVMVKVLSRIVAEDIVFLLLLLLFFREIKTCHFMCIIC